MYGIHIPDKVRFMSITDKVRDTRNTDFVYNGQKMLVPTGTLYASFTVHLIHYNIKKYNISDCSPVDFVIVIYLKKRQFYHSCSAYRMTANLPGPG